jgi:hypothetical protein
MAVGPKPVALTLGPAAGGGNRQGRHRGWALALTQPPE